jgi:hypothetical protein
MVSVVFSSVPCVLQFYWRVCFSIKVCACSKRIWELNANQTYLGSYILDIVTTSTTGSRKLTIKYHIISRTITTAGHRHFPMALSLSYPYPTKWGRYNMFSSCCDKDSAIIFTTGHLMTSTLLETGVGANDCKSNRDQRLNVPSEARRSSR